MNEGEYVIRFRDGKFLRRADYPAPCRVSTDKLVDAERFTEEAANRYLIGKDNPRMNYFFGAEKVLVVQAGPASAMGSKPL